MNDPLNSCCKQQEYEKTLDINLGLRPHMTKEE